MTIFTANGQLEPVAPFDFAQSLHFLGEFMPTQRDQTLSNQSLTKAMVVKNHVVVFEVASTGSIEEPRLSYTLHSQQPLDIDEAEARISFYLSLDDNLRPFYALADSDPNFAAVVQQLYGYHQVKFGLHPFESVCWAILSQRNRLPIAQQMKIALLEALGDSLTVNGMPYSAFPQPQALVEAGESRLTTLIGYAQKAKYLDTAAHAFLNVDETFLRTAPYEEVEAWLRKIKGIGVWSASFVLIRGLGRTDHLSIEQRLLDAASERYQQTMTEDLLRRTGARYGQWQGYWSHYLRASA